MELAELHELHERVCHAFVKADETRNAPILAVLRSSEQAPKRASSP